MLSVSHLGVLEDVDTRIVLYSFLSSYKVVAFGASTKLRGFASRVVRFNLYVTPSSSIHVLLNDVYALSVRFPTIMLSSNVS